ncbi:MAG: hypothetical protein GY757_46840 [bacterium]|nr:hypothetical protein [bacterium]
MKAKISTIIKTNENKMWEELQKISSLMYVASPILKFRPQEGHSIPEKWFPGTEYKFKLSFLGIVPLGEHVIKLVELNKEENRIISNEYGNLTEVWYHVIKFNAIDNQTIEYTDEIEIKAGILTLSIWLFAQIFYKHRQNKWKKLIGS